MMKTSMIITGFSRGITVVGAGSCKTRKHQASKQSEAKQKAMWYNNIIVQCQLTNILSQIATENLWRRSAETASCVFSYKQSTGTQLNHHKHSSLNTERPPLN